MNLPAIGSGRRSEANAKNALQALEEQLNRLELDDELGRIVREGLSRLAPAEQAEIGSDLQFALNSLTPALTHLSNASSAMGQHLGRSVILKGEVSGNEDLVIDGQVEGKVEVREHVLTIGPNGHVKAQVFARVVIVMGRVTGNVTASDRVEIRDDGAVEGDIVSPRVAIAEGAHFRGTVDMQRRLAGRAQAAHPGAERRSRQTDDVLTAREEFRR